MAGTFGDLARQADEHLAAAIGGLYGQSSGMGSAEAVPVAAAIGSVGAVLPSYVIVDAGGAGAHPWLRSAISIRAQVQQATAMLPARDGRGSTGGGPPSARHLAVAGRRHMPAYRELLHAIPAPQPPPRQPPDGPESVCVLCEGISVSAERIRITLASSAAAGTKTGPASADAWMAAAQAAAVAGHGSEMILDSLAARAAVLTPGPVAPPCGPQPRPPAPGRTLTGKPPTPRAPSPPAPRHPARPHPPPIPAISSTGSAASPTPTRPGPPAGPTAPHHATRRTWPPTPRSCGACSPRSTTAPAHTPSGRCHPQRRASRRPKPAVGDPDPPAPRAHQQPTPLPFLRPSSAG